MKAKRHATLMPLRRRRVLYVMNDWVGGGAQTGLVTLLDNGFFEGRELHVVALIRGDGRIEEALRRKLPAGQVHLLSRASRMKPHHMLLGLLAYPLLMLRLRPETVILSLAQANLVGRFWGIFFGGARVVSFDHSTRYPKICYGPLLKALSGTVRAIITDTPTTAREVLSRFYRAGASKKILINLPLFLYRPRRGKIKTSYALQRPLRLLMAGRLSAAKNHESAIRALAALQGQFPQAELHVAGSGECEAELRGLAKKLGVARQVVFHGYVKNWTRLCRQADIYIQPSLYEGLCITVLEAMGCAMPVVAARVGGLADYGRHNGNMLLLDKVDANHLARAIGRLAGDARLRARLGRAALKAVQARFGSSIYAQHISHARQKLGWEA